MVKKVYEREYREAQRRVHRAHDQVRHLYDNLEHSDNRNESYAFTRTDEHYIRVYIEAWHHFIDAARKYYG